MFAGDIECCLFLFSLHSDVENITEVMDEINEQMALGEEIDQAMAEPLGPVMDDVRTFIQCDLPSCWIASSWLNLP